MNKDDLWVGGEDSKGWNGGDDSESPWVMRGGGQTGDREMKLRPAGQTLTEQSILHHPPQPRSLICVCVSLSDSRSSIIYFMCSSFSWFVRWPSMTTDLSRANNRRAFALWCCWVMVLHSLWTDYLGWYPFDSLLLLYQVLQAGNHCLFVFYRQLWCQNATTRFEKWDPALC